MRMFKKITHTFLVIENEKCTVSTEKRGGHVPFCPLLMDVGEGL